MQDWNMPCENGKPSWFIIGCSLAIKWFDLHVGTLIPELAACGLQLNSAKTTSPSASSECVDVCGEMVQVIHAETVHKYLGRNLSGNFLARRNSEFAHRLQVA